MVEQDENEKRKILLESARMRINFSLLILVICALLIWKLEFNSDLFPERPTIIDNGGIVAPANSIDPKDIVDGIHVPSGLIADEGLDLVVNICGNCHSLELVKQNRATETGWKEMIVWMQKTQGLWDLADKEAPILAYLAKNYGPVDTGRRKNLTNIEWYDLKN